MALTANPTLSNQIISHRRTQITCSNSSSSSSSSLSFTANTITGDKDSIINQDGRKKYSKGIDFTPATMSEIMNSSKSQKLNLQLQTLGPFFRITASSLETKKELGRAEGMIRVWVGGKLLHLDSIRLKKETKEMEKSIFGIGLFLGSVAIRHGYDSGCTRAELLAINDSDLYHSKLVKFYKRMGFKVVHEVTGSSMEDLAHMLVWGGKGTRMEAQIDELMLKWSRKFKPPSSLQS